MSKQKESVRRRKQQQSQFRWLMGAGIAVVLIAGFWWVFSHPRSDNVPAQPISKLNTADFHSLAFSLTQPETLYFGHHNGLLVSHNGGKDWQPTSFENADAMALALPLSDSNIMYAAGHDVFFKSTDGGKTWNAITTDLPGLDIHGFTVDPENAERVFAHIVGFGIYRSEDGGSTWVQLADNENPPPSTYNLTMGASSGLLYAAAGDAGLWQSVDGGKVWSPVQNIPDSGAIAVAYVRANKHLYVTTLGNSAGLYLSEDNGQSWQATSFKGLVLAIAVNPVDVNHIVIVNDTGEVFASRDGGLTWSDQ